MNRFLKVIEIMWLIVALVALVTAVLRASSGQSWGSYLYVTLFTGCLAAFMYWFKKRNRQYMESYHEGRKRDGQHPS